MCPWLPPHPRRALPLTQGSITGCTPTAPCPGRAPTITPRPGQRQGHKGRVGFVPSSSDVIGAFYNQG